MTKVKEPNKFTFSVEVPLAIHRLKKYLKENSGLGWSEYLVMCAIDKIEKAKYHVTSREVEKELGMDRCWVYNCIRQLKEKNYVAIDHTDRPWEPNSVMLSVYGEIILRRAKSEFVTMIRDNENKN